MDALIWAVENADSIALLAAAVHGFAVAIVNLTPTPADDRWLGKGYRVVEAAAGILTTTAKLKPGERK